MSGGRTVNFGLLLRVTGHPSWVHTIFFDILPFWQGANARFKLTIEATTDISHESFFSYSIQYANDEIYPTYQLYISAIKESEKRIYSLVPMPLLYTGDAFLVVNQILDNGQHSGNQTVYAFHVTNRSWLWLTILAGLLAGLFATIGNLIIKLIGL